MDTRMRQTMMDAATKMLTLYDAAVTSMLGGWVETQESNGGGIDRSNNPSSTRDRSSEFSAGTKPTVIVTKVTV
ncbi:unnamed protein product [Penicillium viridicatum]